MGLDSAGKYDKDLSSWDNNGSITFSFLIGMQNPDCSFSSPTPTPEGYFEMSEYNTAVTIIALTESSPVVEPKETKWWLWVVLILLIVSMIIFLYINTKRRWK